MSKSSTRLKPPLKFCGTNVKTMSRHPGMTKLLTGTQNPKKHLKSQLQTCTRNDFSWKTLIQFAFNNGISTCHCGAVELEIHLPEGIVDPRRCNCSICRRKGAIVASVPLSGQKVVKGEGKLNLYQFDSKVAEHFSCSVCGIYTHHKRRSNPNQYGFNLACLEDVELHRIVGVKTYDGANSHPSDRSAS